MIKKYLVPVIVCALMALGAVNLGPQAAAAHELDSDGDYYVLLHMEPNDAPEAGVASKLKFAVNKHTDTYNQNNYENRATITKNGKTLATLKVRQSVFGNASDGVADYTFKEAGDYNIQLFGKLLANPNEMFKINFAVHVGAGTGAAGTSNKDGFGKAALIGLIVAAISLAGVVAYMFVPSKFNRIEPKQASKTNRPQTNRPNTNRKSKRI